MDAREQAELLGPGLIHEMRHPLMGIKAGLELIARRYPQIAGIEDWDLVSAQIGRLEELFRTYQDLFRGEPFPGDRFTLDALVKRAVQLVAHRSRKLGSRFSCAIEPRLPHAFGAPHAVLHALVNLLANALDAAEQAGAPARVEIRAFRAGRSLEVRVSDDGAGIAQGDRLRIFEPGFTTKAEGSGLGLYIARAAMRRSGGDVHLIGEADPHRAPWARTELSVLIPEVP
jgi:signal transduction histidine kinase